MNAPTYDAAILADEPTWGDTFTTADGLRMEWVYDMADGAAGYCLTDDDPDANR